MVDSYSVIIKGHWIPIRMFHTGSQTIRTQAATSILCLLNMVFSKGSLWNLLMKNLIAVVHNSFVAGWLNFKDQEELLKASAGLQTKPFSFLIEFSAERLCISSNFISFSLHEAPLWFHPHGVLLIPASGSRLSVLAGTSLRWWQGRAFRESEIKKQFTCFSLSLKLFLSLSSLPQNSCQPVTSCIAATDASWPETAHSASVRMVSRWERMGVAAEVGALRVMPGIPGEWLALGEKGGSPSPRCLFTPLFCFIWHVALTPERSKWLLDLVWPKWDPLSMILRLVVVHDGEI